MIHRLLKRFRTFKTDNSNVHLTDNDLVVVVSIDGDIEIRSDYTYEPGTLIDKVTINTLLRDSNVTLHMDINTTYVTSAVVGSRIYMLLYGNYDMCVVVSMDLVRHDDDGTIGVFISDAITLKIRSNKLSVIGSLITVLDSVTGRYLLFNIGHPNNYISGELLEYPINVSDTEVFLVNNIINVLVTDITLGVLKHYRTLESKPVEVDLDLKSDYIELVANNTPDSIQVLISDNSKFSTSPPEDVLNNTTIQYIMHLDSLKTDSLPMIH